MLNSIVSKTKSDNSWLPDKQHGTQANHTTYSDRAEQILRK